MSVSLTTVTLPDDISTLGPFPARLTATGSFRVGGWWLEQMMNPRDRFTIREVISWVFPPLGALAGGFAGGYFFGIVGAGTFSVLGTLVGAFSSQVHRLAEVGFKGGSIEVSAKLEQAVRNAQEAQKLAQLSVEMAMLLANRPRGVIGGGRVGGNDYLRKLIGERLLDLGFSKTDGSRFARFDDPYIAARIIKHLVLKAVKESSAGGPEIAEKLYSAWFSKAGIMTPDEIERDLGAVAADGDVKSAFDFYRAWHDSDAKLYFTIENMDRLKESASASITSPV